MADNSDQLKREQGNQRRLSQEQNRAHIKKQVRRGALRGAAKGALAGSAEGGVGAIPGAAIGALKGSAEARLSAMQNRRSGKKGTSEKEAPVSKLTKSLKQKIMLWALGIFIALLPWIFAFICLVIVIVVGIIVLEKTGTILGGLISPFSGLGYQLGKMFGNWLFSN